MGKKRTVKIADLNVDIAELQKKDPQILKKIRGGSISRMPAPMAPESITLSLGCSTRLYICPPKPRY